MKKKDEKFKDYISSNYNSTPFFPNKKLSSDVYVKIKGNENKVIYEKICQFCK